MEQQKLKERNKEKKLKRKLIKSINKLHKKCQIKYL